MTIHFEDLAVSIVAHDDLTIFTTLENFIVLYERNGFGVITILLIAIAFAMNGIFLRGAMLLNERFLSRAWEMI